MVVKILNQKSLFTLDNASKIVSMFVAIFTVWNIIINTQQINKLNDEKSKSEKFEQAKSISVWSTDFGGNTQKVTLSNADNTPVYNVFVFLANTQDQRGNLEEYLKFAIGNDTVPYATFIDVLPPGTHEITMNSPGVAAGGAHAIPFMFFTDYKNNQWIRQPSGKLSSYNDYEKKFRNLGFNPPYGTGSLEK